MTDQVDNQVAQTSYLDMSDEELLAVDPSTIGADADVVAQDAGDSSTSAELPDDAGTDDDSDDAEDTEVESQAKDISDTKAESASSKGIAADDDDSDEAISEEDDKEVKPVANVVDYEAEYHRLLTPFKANGKDIAVGSIDDAISLMQMGANYNKKMAGLKPNLKLIKMLETSGLLSEEKINYLIDLSNKNPGAINKLVQDSGIDPMDLGAEQASAYKPSSYKVDDREMELDTVLDEIQGTPSYNRTLDIVSTKWDSNSKQVIAGSPQLLKVINDHVQSGIYDTIVKAVESERMYGRLDGLSDIEAYRQVGDAIQARGGFGNLGHQAKQVSPKPVVVVPNPSKVDDDKLKDKRRAASSTKPAAASSHKQEYNPLALSDEEFSKLSSRQFG